LIVQKHFNGPIARNLVGYNHLYASERPKSNIMQEWRLKQNEIEEKNKLGASRRSIVMPSSNKKKTLM
jgi:hypothetical protein